MSIDEKKTAYKKYDDCNPNCTYVYSAHWNDGLECSPMVREIGVHQSQVESY